MTHQLMQRELVVNLTRDDFQVKRVIDPRIIGPVDYGWAKFCESPDPFTWGGGPLAGIAEAFQAGPEAIPEIVSPYQAAKMDVMEKR